MHIKKIVGIACFGLVAVTFILLVLYVEQRKEHRQQLKRAYSAVLTFEDYGGTDAMQQADLAARQQLDVLFSEDLNADEGRAAEALRKYLSGIENLDSSDSIETTRLRTPIAESAKRSAHAAMMQFLK